jgi:hypothetical protein
MQKAHETNTRTPQELIQLITLKNGQYILHFQQPIMQCFVIFKHIKKFAKTYHIKISVFKKNLKWPHLENRIWQVAIL